MRETRAMIKIAMILVTAVWLIGAAASAVHAEDAKALYEKSCNTCHGPGGKGDGPAGKMLKPPPGDFATVLKGKADADIAKIIKDGGKAVGRSAMMPAFGAKLTDEQIQGIVGYVKELGAK